MVSAAAKFFSAITPKFMFGLLNKSFFGGWISKVFAPLEFDRSVPGHCV